MHVDPYRIPLIKAKNNNKSDKYCVKNKLRRDPTPEKSDRYELKRALFDNGKMEEFLLFISYFIMNLKSSGMIIDGARIQHLCKMVCQEALCQFDTFSTKVESTTSENLESIILGLSTYFFLIMQNQNKST